MSENTIVDINAETEINASISTTWNFLTATSKVPLWLGCMHYKKEIGHIFYMQQDPVKRENEDIEGATHCEILILDEPKHFAFSWYFPDMPRTEVHIHLEETHEKTTRVTLKHINWEQFGNSEQLRAIRDALAGGWTSFVLPQLKSLVEQA